MSSAPLNRFLLGITHRQRLSLSLIPVALSGVTGCWYALNGGGALMLYFLFLLASIAALSPVAKRLDGNERKGPALTANQNDKATDPVGDRRVAELDEMQPGAPDKIKRKPSFRHAQQGLLDLDGLLDLQHQMKVEGRWLVSEASLNAIEVVRAECLNRVVTDEVDHHRISRWFDIVTALNLARHSGTQKAEARRTEVAELQSVSEEQVRQIDQGRYGPLNKILEGIEPASLP